MTATPALGSHSLQVQIALIAAVLACPASHSQPATQPQPETPQHTQLAPGLYMRLVHQVASPAKDYQVEVWSLLLGPGRQTTVKLPGALTLIVHSGRLTVEQAGQRRTLELGMSTALTPGDEVRLTNLDAQRPLNLRGILVRSQ